MPQFYVALTYKSIFDDYDKTSPANLLKDIPTITALNYVSYTCAQLHVNETNWAVQNKLLQLWIKNFPNAVKEKIDSAIKKNHDPSIFDNITSLFTIEDILENNNSENRPLTDEEELSLFKLYLWEAQRWTDSQKGPSDSIPNIEKYISFSVPLMLPFIEHFKYKDFRCQSIKAIYFFQCCENHPIFSEYLNIFLSEYGLKSWQEYLINLLTIYIRPLEEMKVPSKLIFEDGHEFVLNFLNSFCLDLATYSKQPDFKSLREAPVLRTKEKEYLFLNLNFLIDKLFQGIQFDFFRILKEHKQQFNGREINTFPFYKSIYGQSISEPGILYKTLNNCFCKSGYILKNGDEMKKNAGDGYSDYYIRDKNKVYLFEYKDVLLSYPVKSSNDMGIIEQEVIKKFVKDGKGSDEGVSQLANNIHKYRNGGYNKIDKHDYSQTIIYPILIYTDESFSIPGFNYLLRKYFCKVLKDRSLEEDLKIKDVIMINIDTLALYHDLFKEKKLKLNNSLNNYISTYYGVGGNLYEQINSLEPFSASILNDIKKLKCNVSPEYLNEEIIQMISSF